MPDDLLARVARYEDDAVIAARIAARVILLGFMEENSTSYANAVETMMRAQRLRDWSYAAVVRWKTVA